MKYRLFPRLSGILRVARNESALAMSTWRRMGMPTLFQAPLRLHPGASHTEIPAWLRRERGSYRGNTEREKNTLNAIWLNVILRIIFCFLWKLFYQDLEGDCWQHQHCRAGISSGYINKNKESSSRDLILNYVFWCR